MIKPNLLLILTATSLLLPLQCRGWTPSSTPQDSTTTPSLSRRDALTTAAKAAAFLLSSTPAAFAADGDDPSSDSTAVTEKQYRFELRDRNMNKNAVIREDFWYTKGVTPPRKLNAPLVLDDPKWNAFGSCETSGGDAGATNSCTYISLKQRQPAYSKYGFSIVLGAREFQYLGAALQQEDWAKAASLVFINPTTNLPPPAVDALLKMVLFASSMLTSPNFSGPARELLVARFYCNEFGFALSEIQDAIAQKDSPRALAAWEFGKDSFNSYSQVVNRQIVPKVGEPLALIE